MADIDCYNYKAKCSLDGKEFVHEGTVYAEHSWDAAELAEAEVRSQFPGVVIEGDEPGVKVSPQVFVTRDIVNRAVERGHRCPKTGALLPEPIPDEFITGPRNPPTIHRPSGPESLP